MPTRTSIALAILLSFVVGKAAAQGPGPENQNQNKDTATVSNTTPETADDDTFSHFERITRGMRPPKATHAPDPKFPDLPPDADTRAVVVMLVGVNVKGHVAVRVVRSTSQAFEPSAVNTVKTWKFKPGEKNGQPVPVQVTVEMKFER